MDAETALRRAVGGYQVTANLLLFRREALAQVDFGAGSARVNFVEDYDLSVRLADAGWGNVYAGEVLASYRLWEGSSRPVVERKLTEVRGLTAIFEGSLREAFQRRGWPMRALLRRRRALAMANAEILDRGVFAGEQRGEMRAALLALSDAPTVRVAVGAGWWSRWLRRAVAGSGRLHLWMRQKVKRVLFRR